MRLDKGRWSSLDCEDLDPGERQWLLEVDVAGGVVGPLTLWLSERGRPMTASGWEAVFVRAS